MGKTVRVVKPIPAEQLLFYLGQQEELLTKFFEHAIRYRKLKLRSYSDPMSAMTRYFIRLPFETEVVVSEQLNLSQETIIKPRIRLDLARSMARAFTRAVAGASLHDLKSKREQKKHQDPFTVLMRQAQADADHKVKRQRSLRP